MKWMMDIMGKYLDIQRSVNRNPKKSHWRDKELKINIGELPIYILQITSHGSMEISQK